MSNKFLKTLGICMMIILLPVLIAVSAVCLREDINQNKNSYTVYSDYAEETKLEYNEKDGTWAFITTPVRKYYTFVGVKVNGVSYAVVDGKVQLYDDAQKAEFKKNVVDEKKPVNAIWTCDYAWVGLYIDSSVYESAVFGNEQKEVEINVANNIESLGVFTELNFLMFADAEYGLDKMESIEININGETTNRTITFTSSELVNVNGNLDLTIRVLLDKIEAQGTSLNKDVNKFARITITAFNYAV